MKTPKRPVGLMLLAQGICATAAILALFVFAAPMLYAVAYALFADYVGYDNTAIVVIMQLVTALSDLVIGVALACAGLEAFRLCGRVKKASAFSRNNVKSLGRIAVVLAVSGVIALLFGSAFFPQLLTDLPAISPIVEWLLLPFILLTLALMVRAVQVLMRRALTMQEESDLTV